MSFGVDRINPGHTEVSADSLATHRMAELLAELRERYSILLVVAPSLAHSVDMQILAGHAQGWSSWSTLPARVSREARLSLNELQHLNAPILGQIVLGTEL
ncbi:MAG: hypothetical protein U0835_02830 [Isosphaeraceae bacterium]